MINLRDYEKYKEARLSGDSNMLDAMETDDPHACGIYGRIYDCEEVQTHIKELNRQRKVEERYTKWVCLHGYDVKHHKMSDEGFRASFTLSGTVDFYERYKRELAEGKV